MIDPFRRENLPWIGVQIGLFLAFLLLAQAVPVSGTAWLIAAVALSAFFKWALIAVWVNRRHA